MSISTYQRYQSGEICIEEGWYEFDGYIDGSAEQLPPARESNITLGVGDIFPPMQNPKRACYWRLVDGLAEQEAAGFSPQPEYM